MIDQIVSLRAETSTARYTGDSTAQTIAIDKTNRANCS